MSFFRWTQDELDTAFLTAVGKGKFKKAKRLLGQGANPQARDSDGNTAFHVMASSNLGSTSSDCYREFISPDYRVADAFVCVMLAAGLSINAVNNAGATCLHLTSINPYEEDGELAAVLLNRGVDANLTDRLGRTALHWAHTSEQAETLLNGGARVNVQDKGGATPLHMAAKAGKTHMCELMIDADPSALVIRDGKGNCPDEAAVAGPAGHYDLSRLLGVARDAYIAQCAVKQEKEARTRALAENNGWFLLTEDQAGHVTSDPALGYKLTEVFNFRARTYTLISRNLETGGEVSTVKGFDDFADKTLLRDAFDRLRQLGGKAEESAIYRQTIAKGPRFPRPGDPPSSP